MKALAVALSLTLGFGLEVSALSTGAVVMSAAAAPLVSGQRVRVKKMIRDMQSVQQNFKTTGPSSFQDPEVVKSFQKRLKQFETALNRYPQLDDPDVKAARAGYESLRLALLDEYNRAKAQLEKIGNAQQVLAQLDQNFIKYPVPKPLNIPFDKVQASQWVQASGNARTVAEHNKKQLAVIAEYAYLPWNRGTPQTGAPYDSDDVERMQRHADTMFAAVQNNYHATANTLTSRMEQIQNDLKTRWQDDPNSDRKWIYLKKESVDDAKRFFAEARSIADSSIYLEEALKRPPTLARQTIKKIDEAEASFDRNAKIALSVVRLPSPKSQDSERLKSAEEILKNPKYGFGEHGPIVLTTKDIIDRERKSSEIEIDDVELTAGNDLKMSGTETTWTYRWKEFKFAVPLRSEDGKQWHVWWITAKKFSSGGSRTPIGYWVSGRATQGNPILPENF